MIKVLLTTVALACIMCACSKQDKTLHNDNVHCEYTPQDFKKNYEIDLKQDGYLILDEKGDVYYVPFDELEEWFLDDNL